MIRALYSLVLWLAQPLLRRKLRARAVNEPGYGHAIEQRFGYYQDHQEADHRYGIVALTRTATRDELHHAQGRDP